MWKILDASSGNDTHVHVWLNGEKVSDRCVRAIVPEQPGVEGPGQVWLVKLNDKADVYDDPATDELALEVLEGTVRWEPIGY